MRDKRASSPIFTLKNNSRTFWFRFIRESKGFLMILIFGLFFVYLGLVQIIDAYYCLPSSKNELELIKGVIVGIDKSKQEQVFEALSDLATLFLWTRETMFAVFEGLLIIMKSRQCCSGSP